MTVTSEFARVETKKNRSPRENPRMEQWEVTITDAKTGEELGYIFVRARSNPTTKARGWFEGCEEAFDITKRSSTGIFALCKAFEDRFNSKAHKHEVYQTITHEEYKPQN